MKVKNIRTSNENSYEQLMQQTESNRFMLPLFKNKALTEELKKTRLERAIGVIYRPQTELQSHYLKAVLPKQFDETEAVELFSAEPKDEEKIPDTFPFGI